MKDFDICKKIADRLGFGYFVRNEKIFPHDPSVVIKSSLTDVFNPLENPSLCFEIMVSEGVLKTTDEEMGVVYYLQDSGVVYPQSDYGDMKAICLAVANG
jgi:hypothetical protein